MFLGAAIVALFTLIPAVIVRSKEAETRARLLAERDSDTKADGTDIAENDVVKAESEM